MYFASITEGKLRLRLPNGDTHDFELTDEGREAFRTFCEEHEITETTGSSSLDFPEEYGVPEDFGPEEVEEFLQYGLNWQPVRLGVCLSDLEEMVARLERGDVTSVLNALKTWVAEAKEE